MSKAPVSYKYIQGLLDVAEFLVTNPELPEPSSMDNSFITFNYWGKDPAEIQRLARLIPGTMTKNDPKKDSYNGAYYILTSGTKVGGRTVQISAYRDSVCERTETSSTEVQHEARAAYTETVKTYSYECIPLSEAVALDAGKKSLVSA